MQVFNYLFIAPIDSCCIGGSNSVGLRVQRQNRQTMGSPQGNPTLFSTSLHEPTPLLTGAAPTPHLSQGTLLMVFPTHDNWVRSVLFHPSGKYLISCSDDKSIRVLDMKVLVEGHT